MALKVDSDALRETASALHGFIDEANGASQGYLQGTQNLMGAGGWNGPASQANFGSTERVHQALADLNSRWTQLAEVMNKGAADYDHQEHTNTVRAAGIAT